MSGCIEEKQVKDLGISCGFETGIGTLGSILDPFGNESHGN